MTARAPTYGRRGAVAAGHPLATATAIATLTSGGNAMDAALAGSAVLCVVMPAWCGLGGDGFMQVAWHNGETLALNGSGAAPLRIDGATIAGERVPRFGAISVAPPGLVAVWEAAASRFATRPLADLLSPAIAYARDGFPIYPNLARAIAEVTPQLDAFPQTATWLRTAAPDPGVGQPFRQAELAASLERLAADPGDLYRGSLAGHIATALAARGGVLAQDDLARLHIDWQAPLTGRYRGHSITENPPVSMGAVLLAEMAVLDGFDLKTLAPLSADLIDLQVRTKELAFAAADRILGDPITGGVDMDALLGDATIQRWRHTLAQRPAQSGQPDAGGGGETTTSIVTADGAGNIVVLIQSVFNEWGSREVVPGTGILMNDRLANVSLDPAHPNGLRPGRRPLHTLNTFVVHRDGVPVLAGATPGGRGQVQFNMQVLCQLLDFRLDVQAAADAPRWLSGAAYAGPGDRTLYLDPAFDRTLLDDLARRGHRVTVLPHDRIDALGSMTLIERDPLTGTLAAGADSRRDASALAI